MATEQELQERLAAVDGEKKKSQKFSFPMALGVMAVAVSMGAGLLALNAQKEPEEPLSTSNVEDFQARNRPAERLTFEDDKDTSPVEEAVIRIEQVLTPPTPEAKPEIVFSESPALLSELEAMRAALAEANQRDAAVTEAVQGLREAYDQQISQLKETADTSQEELRRLQASAATKETSLQAMLEAERARREAAEGQLLTDELNRSRAEAEAQAARDALELEKAQIVSPALVLGTSSKGAPASSGAGSAAGAGYKASENEQFLQSAPPLVVSESEQMQDPDKTLAQGSIVQAVLQTAINSDLPGNAVAVVSEPVPSFAGNSILIPRGSQLFGAYRSGVQTNQKRILIVWSRILTPDGKSIQISSVGGDALGRSGLTGFVDTKFDERFGGAALISLIGAAPAVAADQISDDVSSDTAQRVAEDLQEATDSVIADQLSISPTIYVDQGSSVTVLVDRDVVVY
ncbi:putative type IV secretion system protein VirB10 (plasmid) [Phaeobacter piscinae]|uniref:Type IV secretion system protein VirB10 n=1 Tax=Phaeobacter piscinae TaxID=1580596 RepID=A0ABN5DKR4_9RHOB|nr:MULTISPECIES: TrbI/VirB10 family protein [Phaeobacter]ATG38092.1 putative type IV secretion system protein VirB10 [Phaeobacter piscinae]AUQ88613.1 putative type IV secretion system protein VirB10 [Phaeobacter piscinae]AUQ92602.1 putative type IV secretion system protein VirB10 [Phaeobacter inhibens]AUR26418.1 putative type IV secretion system protein VirB10 [Phaeobacter piscinae]